MGLHESRCPRSATSAAWARESPGHLAIAGAGVTLADQGNVIEVVLKTLAVGEQTAIDPKQSQSQACKESRRKPAAYRVVDTQCAPLQAYAAYLSGSDLARVWRYLLVPNDTFTFCAAKHCGNLRHGLQVNLMVAGFTI